LGVRLLRGGFVLLCGVSWMLMAESTLVRGVEVAYGSSGTLSDVSASGLDRWEGEEESNVLLIPPQRVHHGLRPESALMHYFPDAAHP